LTCRRDKTGPVMAYTSPKKAQRRIILCDIA
jgi:hypothetical protein